MKQAKTPTTKKSTERAECGDEKVTRKFVYVFLARNMMDSGATGAFCALRFT